MKDANGQQLAYLYFEDEPQRQMSMKRLSRAPRGDGITIDIPSAIAMMPRPKKPAMWNIG